MLADPSSTMDVFIAAISALGLIVAALLPVSPSLLSAIRGSKPAPQLGRPSRGFLEVIPISVLGVESPPLPHVIGQKGWDRARKLRLVFGLVYLVVAFGSLILGTLIEHPRDLIRLSAWGLAAVYTFYGVTSILRGIRLAYGEYNPEPWQFERTLHTRDTAEQLWEAALSASRALSSEIWTSSRALSSELWTWRDQTLKIVVRHGRKLRIWEIVTIEVGTGSPDAVLQVIVRSESLRVRNPDSNHVNVNRITTLLLGVRDQEDALRVPRRPSMRKRASETAATNKCSSQRADRYRECGTNKPGLISEPQVLGFLRRRGFHPQKSAWKVHHFSRR